MGRGIALTEVGRCSNGLCQRPVYAELRAYPGDERCFDCSPVKLLEARDDGGRTYDLGDAILSHDGEFRVLAYRPVPEHLRGRLWN